MATLRPCDGTIHPQPALKPEQPLHLMPHRDAQVDAEREQAEDDQPEADVRGTTLAGTSLTGLALRSVTPVFTTDGTRVVDGYVRRQLPCGLRHAQKSSCLTGDVTAQGFRSHARLVVAILWREGQ